ncbi:hypothetical protein BDP67DRAFT_511908 [Colletotrichum lupini]|nr:hypothetical protein BDP67DRAFT_511908 [Colletotrichum lupini]
MRLLLPLFLFAAYAQAQLILGALALIELTIEVLEAAEVVATIDVSVDLAVTGAEAAETAAVEATVTYVGTTVTRAGEAGIELEGDAAMTGFGRVSREGPGFTQGTFTYRQQFPLGVGPGRRSTANPEISLSWGARTNGVRSGNTNSIQFTNPTISNVRALNPGGKGTSIRVRSSNTRLLAPK